MNIIIIQKPAPHCVIPVGHLCSTYTPAQETDIKHTLKRAGHTTAPAYVWRPQQIGA